MRIVTMPSTPGFTRSNFRLFRAVGVTASPFTGKTKTQEYDAVYWTGNVALPPMKRTQAVEWQSFLLELKGTVNAFKLADPDAKVPTGTYNQDYFTAVKRVTASSAASTVLNANGTLTRSGVFANAYVGAFVHITGATNDGNNGTHKISSTTNNNTVVLDTTFSPNLVTETFDAKIQQNVKGATALQLQRISTGAGTIKKGDYLAVATAASTSSKPAQLVMAIADATVSGTYWAVQTEPKLRTGLTDGYHVRYKGSYPPEGLFRLTSPVIEWDADRTSKYGISFSFAEVV